MTTRRSSPPTTTVKEGDEEEDDDDDDDDDDDEAAPPPPPNPPPKVKVVRSAPKKGVMPRVCSPARPRNRGRTSRFCAARAASRVG